MFADRPSDCRRSTYRSGHREGCSDSSARRRPRKPKEIAEPTRSFEVSWPAGWYDRRIVWTASAVAALIFAIGSANSIDE
jgi:hypothetical protein